MKNLKKLFFVMLGAVAVLAFVSCSSPSSGGEKAYEYKVTINAVSTYNNSHIINGTYYLKKPSSLPERSEYDFYTNPECTISASSTITGFIFYGKNEDNKLKVGFYVIDDCRSVICNLDTKKYTEDGLSINQLEIDDVGYENCPN